MTETRRVASWLAAGIAALGGAILLLLLTPAPTAQAAPPESSRACLECHPGVAEEWAASHHAKAYSNPEVQKLSQNFRNEECLACHTPRPVLGFAPGQRVLARQADRAMGVDCLSCHARPEGGVAAASIRPDRTAVCRPVADPRLSAVDTCGSCHNQHGTVDQWRSSAPALRGRNCLGCHMPEVWREGGRLGRDHRFLAGHDLPTLQQAIQCSVETEEGRWRVVISNQGCAHNFPTDERSRAVDVQVRWKSPDGAHWSEWEHLHRFRDPYRDELDLTNTQLPSGESWIHEGDLPDSPLGQVRVLYRFQPFLPDEDSLEITRLDILP